MDTTSLLAERDRALALRDKAVKMAIAAETKLSELQRAVRQHRDERGDDRCWMDDDRLYQVLPEGYVPPQRDTAVQLDNCRRFIASRQHPLTCYVSPEVRVKELEQAVTTETRINVEQLKQRDEALARIRELEAKIMETRSYYVDRVEDLEHEVTTVRKGLQAENEALKKQLRQQKLYADTAVEVDAMRLRQIEKANTEIAFLRQMLDGMAKRVAEQSELLSKRAELEPSDNNDMRIDEL